jgi:hypothetical protein
MNSKMTSIIIVIVVAVSVWELKSKDSFQKFKVFQINKDKNTTKEIINVQKTLTIVPSVESIKDEYLKDARLVSENDYLTLLKEKENKMDELQLIQKANSGQLNLEESQILLRLMREKIAINQVIVEEKMKKFEGKYF